MGAPILLAVDDDEIVCSLIEIIGNSVGYRVLTTTEPKTFMRLFQEHDVSAIIMDIMMPEIDGYELLEWLAEQNCYVPTIVISGQGDAYLQKVRDLEAELGVFLAATLAKPLEGGFLSATLSNLLSITNQVAKSPPHLNEQDSFQLSSLPEDLSVDEPNLDSDHLKLFKLIGEYQSILETKADKPALHRLLNELLDYTITHFRREEEHMAKLGYPQLENHRQVHNLLARKVSQVLNEAEHDGDTYTQDQFISFLNNWLLNHIMSMDKSYMMWAQEKH